MNAVEIEQPVELSLDAQLAKAIEKACFEQNVSFIPLPDDILQSEFSTCLLVGKTVAIAVYGVTDGDLWTEINPELKVFLRRHALCKKWVVFAADSRLRKGTLTARDDQWTLPLDTALMDLARMTG